MLPFAVRGFWRTTFPRSPSSSDHFLNDNDDEDYDDEDNHIEHDYDANTCLRVHAGSEDAPAAPASFNHAACDKPPVRRKGSAHGGGVISRSVILITIIITIFITTISIAIVIINISRTL